MELKEKLTSIYDSRKLQRLADLAGLRYQTVYAIIKRDGNMLNITERKLSRAIETLEKEEVKK